MSKSNSLVLSDNCNDKSDNDDENFIKSLKSFSDYILFSNKVIEKLIYINNLIPKFQHDYFIHSQNYKISEMKLAFQKNSEALLYLCNYSDKIKKLQMPLNEYQSYKKLSSPKMISCTKTILKQIYREWSNEGLNERNCSWNLIYNTLDKLYPSKEMSKFSKCSYNKSIK